MELSSEEAYKLIANLRKLSSADILLLKRIFKGLRDSSQIQIQHSIDLLKANLK
jgi:hypothetical protein